MKRDHDFYVKIGHEGGVKGSSRRSELIRKGKEANAEKEKQEDGS